MTGESTPVGQAMAAQRRVVELEEALTAQRIARSEAVRELYASTPMTQTGIAELLGVSRALVQAIVEERR